MTKHHAQDIPPDAHLGQSQGDTPDLTLVPETVLSGELFHPSKKDAIP